MCVSVCVTARSKLTTELECTRFTTKLFEAIRNIKDSPSDELAVLLFELTKLKVTISSLTRGIFTS